MGSARGPVKRLKMSGLSFCASDHVADRPGGGKQFAHQLGRRRHLSKISSQLLHPQPAVSSRAGGLDPCLQPWPEGKKCFIAKTETQTYGKQLLFIGSACQHSSNYQVMALPKLSKCWKPKKNHIVCIFSRDDKEHSRSEWQRETLQSGKVCSQMVANLCLALKYRPERLLSMQEEIHLKETISVSLKKAIKAIYGSPVAGH